MQLLTTNVLAAAAQHLPITEALSGIFGSISLTAWICLLLPQLAANYKAQSADGLSMAFLIVWLIGDMSNLIGALFTRLAPTAVALASYFCIADMILISQTIYYRTVSARRAREHNEQSVDASEESPLLARRRTSSFGLPGSQRRHATHTETSMEPLRKIVTGEDETPDSHPWIHNALSLLAVYLVGFVGWFVSYKAGAWDNAEPSAPSPTASTESTTEIIGITLGYFSAVCYLCARIPQIIKNYQEQSCEGLALLFFMLSMTGNLTYGASLVAYSQDKNYLLKTLPWLLGSLGTILEDCVIFIQFRLYSSNDRTSAVI
ncbi:PQ loop repeat-domain-containing protein [Ilyonectria robusta]|uniref:PQ loop repeat-domain-containing protein n=1 Tax=Ilyonectria robusta TaxID=1079257 RepID=UPI001E8D0AA4|nr:PQ loop repeat-domain-containing protein [Ilyonectria robusta]KAH8729690.1 PQ loop repeat-domain-containing protein [Ilyonectria robusta]